MKHCLPGLDKILYRALSLNPRHRYQRAFVLREDLRGLMVGYQFGDIERDAGRNVRTNNPEEFERIVAAHHAHFFYLDDRLLAD